MTDKDTRMATFFILFRRIVGFRMLATKKTVNGGNLTVCYGRYDSVYHGEIEPSGDEIFGDHHRLSIYHDDPVTQASHVGDLLGFF